MPFMSPRGIANMEEVNYNINYKKLSLQKFLEKASRNCRKRYKYYMNSKEPELDMSSQRSLGVGSRDKDNISSPSSKRAAEVRKRSERVAEAKAKAKLR